MFLVSGNLRKSTNPFDVSLREVVSKENNLKRICTYTFGNGVPETYHTNLVLNIEKESEIVVRFCRKTEMEEITYLGKKGHS